jgi:hypothetical protein
MRRLIRWTALAALPLLLALAGCTSSGKKDQGSASAPTTAAGGTASATSGGQAGGDTGSAPALASRETSDGKVRLQLAITQLRRDGSLLFLNLALTNQATGGDNYQVADFLDDGDTNGLGAAQAGLSLDSVDGLYLVDQANKKKHLVARDTERRCLCSANLGNTFVGPGQTVALSATFAAPPAGVQAMDVFVPHAGTFTGVPIG